MAARVDKVTDPGVLSDLLLARRGQAYFSRKLKELRDEEFDRPSAIGGWSRSHVIAHVGYHARGITRLIESAATGVDVPMFESTDQFLDEIEYGSTLTPFALRNLSDHAAVHLTVEWRDLENERWGALVPLRPGRRIPVAQTPWMRACEVWIRAVDLDNGGDFSHFPAEFLDRLLARITEDWHASRQTMGLPLLALKPLDREGAPVLGPAAGEAAELTLTGSSGDLARWAAGRGSRGVLRLGGGAVPEAPLWEP